MRRQLQKERQMKLKRLIAGTVIVGSLGGAALALGAGLANAEPPPGPGPGWVQPGSHDFRPEDRGAYDQAVRDHRPFQYDGQWVNPVFDQGHRGWGFWLGPIWIPLL
jgi:hypothetical protein